MYYPKSKISENQFTGGGLLKDTSSGQTYRGYYYLTFDGRYFSGPSQSINSNELVLIQSSSLATDGSDPLVTAPFVSNFKYDNITQGRMAFLNQGSLPTPIYPSPTPDDYDSGQFSRYFMQRISGNVKDIKEISAKGYQLIQKNPLYISLNLIWKLTGPINDVSRPNYTIYGIESTNLRTVQPLVKTMKGIDQYLNNPLEFARVLEIAPLVTPEKKVISIYVETPVGYAPIPVVTDNFLTDFDGAFLVDFDNEILTTS